MRTSFAPFQGGTPASDLVSSTSLSATGCHERGSDAFESFRFVSVDRRTKQRPSRCARRPNLPQTLRVRHVLRRANLRSLLRR